MTFSDVESKISLLITPLHVAYTFFVVMIYHMIMHYEITGNIPLQFSFFINSKSSNSIQKFQIDRLGIHWYNSYTV